MADYEKDLGTILSLLQKVQSDLEDIKSSLPKPRIDTTDLPTLVWYDALPPYLEMSKGEAIPQKNSANRLNAVSTGHSEIITWLDECGYNYEVKSLKDWDDGYCKRNNIYFIEINQIHDRFDRFVEFISPEAMRLCKEGKLAFVWHFPHEGFGFEALRKKRPRKNVEAGWFEMLTLEIMKHDLVVGKHYLINGDLRIQSNFDDWKETYPKYDHVFDRVMGLDFFNHHYFLQYVHRTQLKLDANSTTVNVHNYETYGYLPNAKVRHFYIEPNDVFGEIGDPISVDRAEHHWAMSQLPRIKTREILEGIPTPEDKTKDLICFNARERDHRAVMVSELFRLGYDNNNSHISWMERKALETSSIDTWRTLCFDRLGKDEWVGSEKRNGWRELMNSIESREHFYDFWGNHGTIISDCNTDQVHADDRTIPVDMFRESYFLLVTETLYSGNSKDCLQITEKTYKALAYRMPFIIVGSYGTLEYLKSLGYQTFPHMFDESYDEIEDPAERMSAICNELKKWKNMSDEEKRDRYGKTMTTLKHNYHHFKSSSPNRMIEVKKVFDRLKLHV